MTWSYPAQYDGHFSRVVQIPEHRRSSYLLATSSISSSMSWSFYTEKYFAIWLEFSQAMLYIWGYCEKFYVHDSSLSPFSIIYRKGLLNFVLIFCRDYFAESVYQLYEPLGRVFLGHLHILSYHFQIKILWILAFQSVSSWSCPVILLF